MTKEKMKRERDARVTTALRWLGVLTMLDIYVEEQVVFGNIKTGDKVPFSEYAEQLRIGIPDLSELEKAKEKNFSEGVVTCENNLLLCYDYYADRVEYLFMEVPIVKGAPDNDIISNFQFGIYEYLKELFKIFREIIATEVELDFFATMPDVIDTREQSRYYDIMFKVIEAVLTKKLKQGSRIDKYLKNTPFLSPIFMRLIEKRKGHYYLINGDRESLNFKLATLSCLQFLNVENTKLFEIKLLRWEELQNSKTE